MPILPSVNTIERPTPRPAGGIVSLQPQLFPTGGVEEARALANTGQQLVGMSEAFAQANAQLTSARRGAQLTDAVGRATVGLGELEMKFKRDQDFKTAPERFKIESEKLSSMISQGIDDNVVKQAFSQRFRELSMSKQLNVLSAATVQEGDFNKARLDENLDVYATAAANASNPAERAIVENQARLALTEMRAAGWITDVEAGVRQRGFLSKIDQAVVQRDMTSDAFATANKLATDATYAPALDPVQRERLIDSGLRRAEANDRRADAEAKKVQAQITDEAMKDAWDLIKTGSFTPAHLAAMRPKLSQGEYHSLQTAMKNQGKAGEDSNAAYADLQRMLYPPGGGAPDMNAVSQAAFAYHKRGQIKDSTLSAVLGNARELGRVEGPRSPYERSKSFIISSLEPSAMTFDPAPKARQGLAAKEFDDWMTSRGSNKPADKEIEEKAKSIIDKYALINMNDLATKTGGNKDATPDANLKRVEAETAKLFKQMEAKTISKSEFDRKMADLNRLRKAAEKAGGVAK